MSQRNDNLWRGRAAIVFGAALVALILPAFAQQSGGDETFSQAASAAERDLAKAKRELAELRDRIAAEKIPLTREITALETRLVELRRESESVGRDLDTRNLDVTKVQTETKARQEEKTYLSSLLDEYSRNLETRLHVAEIQRYREVLERGRNLAIDESASPAEVFAAQGDLVEASLSRLEDIIGGTLFEGKALAEGGVLTEGKFALVGPIAVFRSTDGKTIGLAEQKLGSLEANVIPFDEPAMTELAGGLVATGNGRLPIDPTMGNARKIEETQETLIEHMSKGGPVMVPIILLAAAALVVAVYKWIQLSLVPKPTERKVQGLLEAVRRRDFAQANKVAADLKGPEGEMLRVGLDHVGETKELVEEMMFEKMLDTKLKLQSLLSFIAISAAAAPLLGLLGTVTGIINTFKLITVYGTGDAKTLSSGISEALITTEFGLIVAIPSLLLHAYLSRRAKKFVDGMEKTAIALLNRLSARREEPQPAAEKAAVSQ